MIDYEVLNIPAFEDIRGSTQQLINLKRYHSEILNQTQMKLESVLFSKSKQNVVRGLHYQEKPYNQIKVISCLLGNIVAYVFNLQTKKHYEIQLDSQKTLIINNNCAFGFKVISDLALLLYLFDKSQNKQSERVIDIFSIIQYNNKYILSPRDSL